MDRAPGGLICHRCAYGSPRHAVAVRDPGPRWSEAGMLSAGADSVARCPQRLAKLALPSVRVSAYVGFRQALPAPLGGMASVSSVVVAPASIEPLSMTWLGVVEYWSS